MRQRRTAYALSLAYLAPLLGVMLTVWASARAATPSAKAAAPATAAANPEAVQALLQKSCLGCHGVGAQLSGLDLRSRAASLKGGTRGPSLVPGHADRSLLYRMVTGERSPLMPPTGKLSTEEIALLKRWIDGGAPWPGLSIKTARPQVWWSFRAPVTPRVPAFPKDAWVRNPVDAFVFQRLRASGLSPSPPAPRAVLIRRAYLDLIGLPPTPDEVRAFVADTSPDAWEKVVDRLLAGPHYGERWGRHWLDLVRYADSGGFEGDADRPLAWRYRDYVIDAFNRDKPYATFLREQIAGDELPERTNETIIATGYLAAGQKDLVGMAMEERRRADELDDLVSTTGSAVLGLTVGCARCHDHKYDPISTNDYYRMLALFAPTVRREIEIPTANERARADAHNAPLDKELAPLRARADALRPEAAKSEDAKKQLAEAEAAVKAIEAKRVALPKALAVTDGGRDFAPVYVHLRGDPYRQGAQVRPGFITTLPGGMASVGPPADPKAQTTGRRRALADWLTSPRNPLPARVWMNRVWRQHFGRGLVNTPSNFGVSGDRPSHPALLDWLAVRFQKEGGRLKPMHRLLLLSSTYRQDSAIRAAAAKADPQNRLLWRMPVRRLEAEPIRDSLLFVAGSLNPERGGPPVHPPVDPSLRADTFQGVNWPGDTEDSPKTWRRSVYVKVKRSLLLPQLEAFDCPEISASVPQRNVTTTPTQALTLLNDPLIRRQARLFAERLKREAGPKPEKQVARAYWLALGRAPSVRETSLGVAFLRGGGPDGLVDFAHAVFNLNEFVYVP